MVHPIAAKILILEHDTNDLELLLRELKKAGSRFLVQITENQESFTRALEAFRPDLILSDYTLPSFDGFSAFRIAQEVCPDIPFIIVSGTIGEERAVELIKAGVTDYVLKDRLFSVLSKADRALKEASDRREKLVAEEELRKSNERFSMATRATFDAIWDIDLRTRSLYWGEGFQTLFGYEDRKQRNFEDWLENIHPEDKQRVLQTVEEVENDPERNNWTNVYRFRKKDGSYAYVIDKGILLRDSEGRPCRLVGAMQDITERKKAEIRLQLSERRFRSLVQEGADLISVIDVEGNYTYVSPNFGRILGYEPDYLKGKNAFRFIHSKDTERVKADLQSVREKKRVTIRPFCFRHASGEWRWIETNLTNMLHEPEVEGIICNSSDVTERIRHEEELQRLSLVATKTVNGVIIANADREITWINDSFSRMSGYTFYELAGRKTSFFYPGPETDADTCAYVEQQLKDHQPFDCEILSYSRQGHPYWVHLQGQPILDESGRIVQYFAMLTDITKEKQSVEEIAMHREQLKALVSNSFDAVEVIDSEAKIIFSSPAIERILGYTSEQVVGQNGFAYIHPDDHSLASSCLQDVLEHPDKVAVVELRVINRRGDWKICELAGRNMLDNPYIRGIVLNLRDVTERKQAEKLLKDSEHRYRYLFEESPMPMWVFDITTFRFLEVNPAAMRLYGYSREEFLQMTLLDIRIESEKERFLKLVPGRLQETEPVYFGEWLHLKKSGAAIHVEIVSNRINYEGRQASLILINDITERKKLQEQLTREKVNQQKQIVRATIQMQEKEREAIGRELHDNVNQLLTSAKLYLDLSIDRPESSRELVTKSRAIIMGAITEIRSLAKALVPPMISDLGLRHSLGDLTGTMEGLQGISFELQLDFDEEKLSDVMKLTIFRIVQEQLTNIVKYSKASRAVVRIVQRGREVELAIQDNGVGFNLNEKRKGIGIHNIFKRAESLDGTAEIKTRPGEGCLIFARFPVHREMDAVS